jgi:hypothetical protein
MTYERPAIERRVPASDPVIRGVPVSTPTWTDADPGDARRR